MNAPKLTVIGLDAATFRVIDPLVSAGELPNIQRLMRTGCRGVLTSTIHPITSQAWATAFTGVNAGRHGLWEFSEREAPGYRFRLVNGSFRRAPAVWDLLSDAGRRVGVVNVPFTWPATPVNGFVVAGIDSAGRDERVTHPPELVDELRAHLGPLELDHMAPLDQTGEIDIERVRREAEQKVEAALWLSERFEPELLIVVFMASDHVQHYGWIDWEQAGSESSVASAYRILDEAVGALTDAVTPHGDVLVLSDHGAGLLKGVVNLNAWLAAKGYLQYVNRADGIRRDGFAKPAVAAIRKSLPKSVRRAARKRMPRLRERLDVREFTAVDWGRTRAFAYGDMGNVVINVRGRDELGVVEPGAEYDRLCDEISAAAVELVDPATGEPIVAAVHRRSDLCHGPYLDKIPDLVVEFDDYAWTGKGNLRRRTESLLDSITLTGEDKPVVGGHRPDGIAILAGDSARAGGTFGPRCEDIAPTILYLLGEPVPDDLDGRILEEALNPELLHARPPTYRTATDARITPEEAYAEEDAEAVERRLRGLGYLE